MKRESKTKEIEVRIINKVDLIKDWFDDIVGGEYSVNNKLALNLLQKLEEEEEKENEKE